MKKALILFILFFGSTFANHSLLIEFPWISNVESLEQTLIAYDEKLSKKETIHFLAICPKEMEKRDLSKLIERYPNLTLFFSEAKKSENGNAFLSIGMNNFDMVLLADENVLPTIEGFDIIIIEEMIKAYPKLNGVLNISNGSDSQNLNHIPLVGSKYIEHFGYLLPTYYETMKFAKKEFTYVSRIFAREQLSNEVVFGIKNEVIEEDEYPNDIDAFEIRSLNNFDIPDDYYKNKFPKIWSILICTLEERKEKFNFIQKKLKKQIKKLNLENEIEVLHICDNREMSVGTKRNELVKLAKGQYINFIDDDDDVHEKYIEMIYSKIIKGPDCVSLKGIITTNGKNPKTFIHSIKFDDFFEKNNTYYRPPNHLNTMKRSIGSRYLFPNTYYGEDTEWARQILNERALKVEAEIPVPYYFYRYKEK